MEYSEEQIREFKEEFAKRRKAQILFAVAAVVVALALGIFSQVWSQALAGNEWLVAGIVIVLALVTVVFSVRNGRCPACGGLVSNSWRLRFCPLCGVPLR
jgi:hypothetical protein